jgi:hypothetical protein
MSGLLQRPPRLTVNTTSTSGLMAKPKLADDETVKAMLAALHTYRSGERSG